MSPGTLKVSSANLMSVGSFHLLVSSFVAGVVPVMSGNTAQLRMSCQLVCLISYEQIHNVLQQHLND